LLLPVRRWPVAWSRRPRLPHRLFRSRNQSCFHFQPLRNVETTMSTWIFCTFEDPKAMFSAMLPENRTGSCVTTPVWHERKNETKSKK
jgi:hypothetical protein